MPKAIYGGLQEFMPAKDVERLMATGIVTVTVLMECNLEAVAERTGEDITWLYEKRAASHTRVEAR